jgi:signal peptidase I
MGNKMENSPVDSVKTVKHPATHHPSLISHHSLLTTHHLFMDLSTDLLRRGKSVRFRAPGQSMHPTIKPNETITVKPVVPSAIEVGDIILYDWEEGVIAHRVVRIEGGDSDVPRFILRGDASTACDAPVAVEQILGKVVSVERTGRSINPYSLKANMTRLIFALVSRPRGRMVHCLRWLVGCLPINRNNII